MTENDLAKELFLRTDLTAEQIRQVVSIVNLPKGVEPTNTEAAQVRELQGVIDVYDRRILQLEAELQRHGFPIPASINEEDI